MTRFLSLTLLVATLFGLSHTARADENAEARILFEQGNRQLATAMHQRGPHRREGLEQALESYIASVRIVRSKNAVFNCAAVLQELGRVEEAYDYYSEYLAMPGVTDQDRADAEARLAAIRPQLAIIEVDTTPPGAEVRVDRRDLAPRGRTPLTFAVPPGDHVLHIDSAGFAHQEAMVSPRVGETTRVVRELGALPVHVRVLAPAGMHVSIDGIAGDTQEVSPGVHTARGDMNGQPTLERRFEVEAGGAPMTIELDATTAGVVEGHGRLVVEGNVSGRIVVDGRPVSTGQRGANVELGSGQHALRVEGPGHLPYEGMLEVRVGRTTHAHITLGRDPTTLRHMGAWPWVSAVATVIVAAIFVGTTAAAFKAHDDYDTARSAYIADNTSMNLGHLTTATGGLDAANGAADAMFVVTLIFAGLTTFLFLMDESTGPPTHGDVNVDETASPSGATARISTGGVAW